MAQIQNQLRPVAPVQQGFFKSFSAVTPVHNVQLHIGSGHHHRHHQALHVLTVTSSNSWANQ